MSIPICIRIKELRDPQRLILPGGVAIEHINLLDVIQPALTPLVPLFNLIDAILAVFEAIKAVPAMIGPPPDPTALVTALKKLGEKVSKLLYLVPQLSLPLTVIGLIDLVIDTLDQVLTQLRHLQQQMTQITNAIDRASELDDPGLMTIAYCARDNIDQEAANALKGLAAIGSLIGLLNLFIGMIGGPRLPDLSDLGGRPLDDAVQPLDALLDILKDARSMIPVP